MDKPTTDSDKRGCSRCQRSAPEVSFYSTHDWCRQCLRTYANARGRSKRSFLNDYKTNHGCTDCGYNTHPGALEFDHLPGTEKLFNISQKATQVRISALMVEIQKCEVVCANCHRVRTADRHQARRDAASPDGWDPSRQISEQAIARQEEKQRFLDEWLNSPDQPPEPAPVVVPQPSQVEITWSGPDGIGEGALDMERLWWEEAAFLVFNQSRSVFHHPHHPHPLIGPPTGPVRDLRTLAKEAKLRRLAS